MNLQSYAVTPTETLWYRYVHFRGTSTNDDFFTSCTCKRIKDLKGQERRSKSPSPLRRLLKRASILLSAKKAEKLSRRSASLSCFANSSMSALIGQREELTRHFVTTLVALNEVNQEIERLFAQREKHLLAYPYYDDSGIS